MSPFKEAGEQTIPQEVLSPGQILRNVREKFGLSQDETARLAGIAQGYISQIENNKVKSLGLGSTLKLAQLFGQGILFLEGGENKKVFLLPLSRKIHHFLLGENNPQDLDYLEETFNRIFQKYPQVGDNNLFYIDQADQRPLGQRLKELRAGRFQREFAKAVGVSQPTISQIEKGNINIKDLAIKNLAKIAQGAQITIEELLDLREILVHPKIRNFDQILRDENIPQSDRKWLGDYSQSTLRLLKGI